MTNLNNKYGVETLLRSNPNASIRKIALATETTYSLLLKASKKPIPNEPYDPDKVNYEAISEYFNKREIDLDTLDWEALNETTARRPGTVEKDMSKFEVGSKVYLRKNPTIPYEVIYKTDTHIVIMLEDTTEPQAWAHNTFLLNGPQFTPRGEKVDSDKKSEPAKKDDDVGLNMAEKLANRKKRTKKTEKGS